jgi:hypothetical protein
MARVRWGVLSTASIGRLVIEATRDAGHAEFVAVASRDADRARAFADELGLEASYGSYEELLASRTVDAVYVPCPSPSTPSGRSRRWRRARTSSARSRSPPAPPTPPAASTPPRRPAATASRA